MNTVLFMSNTIDDFSNFFRSDKHRCNFNVNRAVKSALVLVGASLKNSDIKVDLATEERITACGYRNEYAQVLLNVISNARDVLLERKVCEPTIRIRIRGEEGRSVVTISDNAGGIPEDILLRIFDPYFSTKEAGKGTGIGLYMSKVIIEHNMGGSLTVCNTGHGAEFRIEI
jgi:C4-dicarboxylate-specific signal transduction histidine kinase